MFHGLRTAIYHVDDVQQAKAWYTSILGVEPYFDQPYYVGFSVGGYELGLQPEAGAVPEKPASVVAYWGVDDAEEALRRLVDLGAVPHEPLQDVGDGVRVAAVRDPFGNAFGIIENPHFAQPSR